MDQIIFAFISFIYNFVEINNFFFFINKAHLKSNVDF